MKENVFVKDKMTDLDLCIAVLFNVLINPFLIWLLWNTIASYRGFWTIGFYETWCACILVASIRAAIFGAKDRGSWQRIDTYVK